MVKVHKFGIMVNNIKVNGLKIICVVKDKWNGKTVVVMLVYLIKINQMVMEYLNGQVFYIYNRW